MNFFEIFGKLTEKSPNFVHKLHEEISTNLKNSTEEIIIETACLAGIMSRVAMADMKVHDTERLEIKKALQRWTNHSEEECELVANIALKHIRELAGLENHKYCLPLNEIYDNDQKYHLLESLFDLAASDDGVDMHETEEIRLICKSLLLEQKHFISARATVVEKLNVLKSN